MTTKIITVEATPPAESTGADYYKGAPLNAAEFDQNLVNLRAAVDRKASLSNPTFTGTVTLPSTTSIGDVSATELQYLNSVTSNVQDQINAKAPINNPTFTGTVSLSTGTANGVLYLNGSKQVTSGSGLVFDSSGNLGLGVTPSAWSGYGAPVIEAPSGGTFVTTGNGINIGSNWYYSGGNFLYKTSAPANYYQQSSGSHKWFNAPSGTAGDPITFTQAMTLDASGRLGIGTTSPTNTLSVKGNANITGNTTLGDASTDTVTVNGYMGVGGAPTGNIGLQIFSSALTGAGPIGIASTPVGPAAATTSVRAFLGRADTAAASFTTADVMQFQAANSTKGAGSTITNQHGVYIADQTQGTNNYGITSLVSSGTNKWNIYASGTAANYFAGNVGIGTSSPGAKVHAYDTSNSKIHSQTTTGYAQFQASSTSGDFHIAIDNSSGAGFGSGAYARIIYSTGAYPIVFSTNATERMRLDSSGNLMVGTTSSSARLMLVPDASYNLCIRTNPLGSTLPYDFAIFNNTSTAVGSIVVGSTSTAYNTSSDYRLKEDYQPVTDAIARLNQLKPINFAWKVDGSRCDGFLAHELQEVIPEAATGHKDEMRTEEYEVTPAVKDEEGNVIAEAVMGEREVPVYQGIDQSKIVPLLTAALQEAVAKIESQAQTIESLTQRIEALEYKGE